MAGKPTPRRAAAPPPSGTSSRSTRDPRGDPRTTRPRNYWLLKSEPASFSIDDLARAPRQTTFWSGVRNYQARNLLRDELSVGDGVIFYHSNAKPPGAVGLAEVVRAGYPDPTQFEATSEYFDPAATPDAPRWYVVDVRLQERFVRDVSLDEMRTTPALDDMVLLRRGSRLSVQPVSPGEWKAIVALGRRRA
jgi:predicted RNA-binding protein with PUA-like domain